ncbi:MAG: hypothetical protein IJW29_08550 [Clostridia bacterium]|nr:hypothetical protein [Clostridia bacterium]
MMKRKILIPVLALMLCVGMIGVGFAAWVIATTTTADVNEGTQFTVYDVANKSVQFDSEFKDGSITFGTTSTTYERPWLTLEEGTTEDLSATLEISITNWSDVSASGKVVTINISAMSIMNGSSNVTDTYKDTYVVLPAARTITITAGALDQTSIDAGIKLVNGVLTIPMTFDWGSYFGGENPHDFYNSNGASDAMASTDAGYDSTCATYVAHADKHLKAFYAMNGLSFQVTVTADLTVN